MDIPLPTFDAPRPIPTVCRLLRTKNSFQTFTAEELDENAPWQFGESTTAVFWCLKTMQHAGPDDDFAHPSTCCAGRPCFCPEEE